MQEILDKWKIRIDYNTLLSMWNESQRFWHDQSHLLDLFSQINENRNLYSQKEYEKLLICSIFHDIVFDPTRNDNEERSSEFFLNCCEDKNSDILDINKMILDTKNHKSSNRLSNAFNEYDMSICERDFDSLVDWENKIYEEFKFHGKEAYKKGRVEFLESILDKYIHNNKNILSLISWVEKNY